MLTSSYTQDPRKIKIFFQIYILKKKNPLEEDDIRSALLLSLWLGLALILISIGIFSQC